MDTLKNKQYAKFDYLSRYINVPYYYDTINGREMRGLCSNLSKDTSWVAHKIKAEDTLDSLALKYYNNPTYWWAIAFFNDIQDPLIDLKTKFKIIKIPSINSIQFGNERG